MFNPVKNFLDENNISLESDDIITLEQMTVDILSIEDIDHEELEKDIAISLEAKSDLARVAVMVGGVVLIALIVAAFVKNAKASSKRAALQAKFARASAASFAKAGKRADEILNKMRAERAEFERKSKDKTDYKSSVDSAVDQYRRAYLDLVNPLTVSPIAFALKPSPPECMLVQESLDFANKALPDIMVQITANVEHIVEQEQAMKGVDGPTEYLNTIKDGSSLTKAGTYGMRGDVMSSMMSGEVNLVAIHKMLTSRVSNSKSYKLTMDELADRTYGDKEVSSILTEYDALVSDSSKAAIDVTRLVENTLGKLDKRAAELDKLLADMLKAANDEDVIEHVAVEDNSVDISKDQIEKAKNVLSKTFNRACLMVTRYGNINRDVLMFQFQRGHATIGKVIKAIDSAEKALNGEGAKYFDASSVTGMKSSLSKNKQHMAAIKSKMDKIQAKINT